MHEIGTDIANGEPVRLSADAKRRHLYVIGKSGVGKTNLLRTLMLEDFAAGAGFCFLDPHGDEAERLADSTPPERFDEVIYFDPADLSRSIGYNPLEGVEPDLRPLAAEQVLSAFAHVWGLSMRDPAAAAHPAQCAPALARHAGLDAARHNQAPHRRPLSRAAAAPLPGPRGQDGEVAPIGFGNVGPPLRGLDKACGQQCAEERRGLLADPEPARVNGAPPLPQHVADRRIGGERAGFVEDRRPQGYRPRDGRQEVAVSILVWIVLGLAAGFLASKIVSNTGEGTVVDILLGIVGAIVGGWLFNFVGAAGVTGLHIYSLFVAIVGASIVLFLYHASFRGRMR